MYSRSLWLSLSLTHSLSLSYSRRSTYWLLYRIFLIKNLKIYTDQLSISQCISISIRSSFVQVKFIFSLKVSTCIYEVRSRMPQGCPGSGSGTKFGSLGQNLCIHFHSGNFNLHIIWLLAQNSLDNADVRSIRVCYFGVVHFSLQCVRSL